MIRTAALLAALALVLGLALSGCASSGSSSETAETAAAPTVVPPTDVSADHNETDLVYVDRLGSQHQQAVDMVAMVANRDVSPALRALAAEIGRDRSAEMKALSRMAGAWGVPPHRPDFHGNPGELTLDQLSELYGLDGAAFEEAWTRRMVDNHLGAVAMAKAELDDGLNLGTREFARGLIRAQEAQIERLKAAHE